MAERHPVMGQAPTNPELERLLEQTSEIKVTETDLLEQRISFAYGNAPQSSKITKESVRDASKSILINR